MRSQLRYHLLFLLPAVLLLGGVGFAWQNAKALPVIRQPKLAPEVPVDPPGDGPWVVRATYYQPQMLRLLAARLEPWEVHPDAGYLVAEIDLETYRWMQSLGFSLQIEQELTSLLQQPRLPLPDQTAGIPGYPCYRTVEETYAAAQKLAVSHPELATWIDIGDSWEKSAAGGLPGFDLHVLRLANDAIPSFKPGLFIMSSVHAREYAPAELNLRFAEHLLQNYGVDADVTWLLDYNQIHLLFQANPDGRKQAETGWLWRKNTDNLYCSNTSNRGADLNRNFSFQWGCCGGSSGNQCNEVYRGPTPASEPETQAIQDYVRLHFPDQRSNDLNAPAPETASGIFLDLHSYGRLVLWPWGFTSQPAPNAAALGTLGRKLAFFNNYSPQPSYELYPTDGTTNDFAYGELGLAAYTLEVGNTFFQDCATFEQTIVPENFPALLYATKVARSPYLLPAGPETLELTLTPRYATPGGAVQITAQIDDTRYNHSPQAEPTQTIAAAEAYIDAPPWENPSPLSMSALDGAFDEPGETVGVLLDTTNLTEGRHMLFVRGQDEAGNWGTPSAIFLDILRPSIAPRMEGHVRQAVTRLPLAAEISAGAALAWSDPQTGFYTTHVLSGTYILSASAPGHLITSTTALSAPNYRLVRQDFSLYPICTIWSDDVEAGNRGWSASAAWAISTDAYHSPIHSWSDSPNGNYANNLNISLTSPLIDLSSYRGVAMSFWHSYELEENHDLGRVDISADGGTSWQQVAAFSGRNPGAWFQETLSLPALDGATNARIRFRLTTDAAQNYDGWHLDDIVLSGGGAPCLPNIPPHAGFTAAPAMAGIPLTFSNHSYGTPPLSYTWDFGDGSNPSYDEQPTHTYPNPGTYMVALIVANPLGRDSLSLPVVVSPAPAAYLGPVLRGKPAD